MNNVLQLWRKRKDGQTELDKAVGDSGLNNLEKDVYLFLAANKACITTIRREHFFRDASFSTIKRAILSLYRANLIYQYQDSQDKRIYWLKVK